MTGAHAITIITAVVLSVVVVELVRRRQLRDKYAALFLALAAGMILFAIAPSVLTGLAAVLSIVAVADALFFVGMLVLLVIVVHLTWEVSRLETETRLLAEEIALLRLETESSQRATELHAKPDNPNA